MKRHIAYLKYVIRHKWYVFLACLRFGLVWRGIIHDWTKFLPSEWFPYVHEFYGKSVVEEKTGYRHVFDPNDKSFNIAWNHHQKRNDHHWQYWLLNFDDGGMEALPMPDKCRREMLADWMGAGKAQGKPKTWEWYAANKERIVIHPDTRVWIEAELEKLYADFQADMKGIGMGFLTSSWWL